MTALLIIVLIAAWLVCGWIGYVITRSSWRREFGRWSVGDRRDFLPAAFLAGPLFMIAAAVDYHTSRRDRKEDARW
jgi:hypothetical protein